MVLSIIFLEDKHKIVLHLSIFYEYQQFFQYRICFSIQPPDYSDPWLVTSQQFFLLIRLFNNKSCISSKYMQEPSWSWSYGSCIYNYLFNQCLSPLTLWVRIPLMARCMILSDTILCDNVCQWLATGWGFSPVSSTDKTDRHDTTEILLKVALNTITLT